MDNRGRLRLILWGTSAILVLTSVFLDRPGSTYRYAFLFLVPLALCFGGIISARDRAVHELVECGTTILLGKEKGMLKLDPNDPYDTQKDLLNNLLGALLAVILSKLAARRSLRRSNPAVCAGRPEIKPKQT